MAAGAVEVFDAGALAAPDRFDGWRQAVNEAFVPLHATPLGGPLSLHDGARSPRALGAPGAGAGSRGVGPSLSGGAGGPAPGAEGPGFSGALLSQDLGAACATEVAGTAVRVWRDAAAIAHADPGIYKLGLQVHGYSVLAQDGREAALTPGDLAIYDTTRPYSLDFEDRFSMFVLMIPRDRLGLTPAQVARLTAERISGRHGLGALASSLLGGLGRALRTGGVDPEPRAVDAVLDLVQATLLQRLGPEPSVPTADVVFAAACAYIDEHVGRPELSVEEVAAAQHVSVRYLQQLFSQRGATPSAWIRRRRLEGCRADLADPRLASRPVSAIGAHWGFADASGFARAFKAAEGLTPGEYRAERLTR